MAKKNNPRQTKTKKDGAVVVSVKGAKTAQRVRFLWLLAYMYLGTAL